MNGSDHCLKLLYGLTRSLSLFIKVMKVLMGSDLCFIKVLISYTSISITLKRLDGYCEKGCENLKDDFVCLCFCWVPP